MERNKSLDALKLVLASMVLGIHTQFCMDISEIGTALTVHGIFRIAVPIFFLINGLYFHRVIVEGRYLQWTKRFLILYAFWMVFYSYFWLTPLEPTLAGGVQLILTVLFGYLHLWYVSGVIGAGMILFLLRKAPSSVIGISILITYLSGVFVQYAGAFNLFKNSALDDLFDNYWAYRNVLLFAYPFFALGFLISKHSMQDFFSTRTTIITIVLGVVFLLLEASLNYLYTNNAGAKDSLLSLLLVCPAVFIFTIKRKTLSKGKELALYASAMYFIHVLFLNAFSKFTHIRETKLTMVLIAVSVIAAMFLVKVHKKFRFIL